MRKTFYIADTHFGHANIIKYCHRPYRHVWEMDKDMIERWNAVVGRDDIVIHGGDFALVGRDALKDLWHNTLHGDKLLVRGNHDGSARHLTECGIRHVNGPFVDRKITVVHDPKSLLQMSLRDGHTYLYGHVHNNSHIRPAAHTFNISVEAIGYTPRTIEEIKKIYASQPIAYSRI